MEERLPRNNGHDDPAAVEETEDLDAVRKNLEKLTRGDGTLVTVPKQYMGVLQKLASTIEGDDQYRQALYMADFLNEGDAQDAAAAIMEAKRYGGSVEPIVDQIIAMCAVNRRGNKTNRAAQILDVLNHYSVTNHSSSGGRRGNGANPDYRIQSR